MRLEEKSSTLSGGSSTLHSGRWHAEKGLLAPVYSHFIDHRIDFVNLLEPGSCAASGDCVLVGGLSERMV
jgi:hypothetical protein